MRGINVKPVVRDESPEEVEGEDAKEDVEEEWEKGIPPFVRKLTKMVGENPQSIDWTPSGSFIVKEIDSFGSTLLPKYFKSIKFCSFVRQLNMYNFHKVEDHPQSTNKSMEFKNPYFLPGRKDLLKKIHRRKTVKRSKEDDDHDASPSKDSPQEPPAKVPATSPAVVDETSYKGLLSAVLKIQQQVELNQLALKSVVDELNYFRKSHYDLEQKIQHFQMPMSTPVQHQPINNIYAYTTNAFSSNPSPYTSPAPALSSNFSTISNMPPQGVQYNPLNNSIHQQLQQQQQQLQQQQQQQQQQPAPQLTPVYTNSAPHNNGFAFAAPSTTDISSLLFSDDLSSTSPAATTSVSGNNRGSLLSLMQSSDMKAFEFTSILQPDADPSTPNTNGLQLTQATSPTLSRSNGSASNIPITLYDNNHFDVY